VKKILSYFLVGFIFFLFISLFPKIAVASDPIGSWTFVSSMNAPRFYHTAVTVGNYIYVIGGSDGTQHIATVERALVNPDGSLGSWESMPSMTTSRMHPAATVYGNYIYVSGGEAVSGGGPVGSVERASIDPDFVLGTWEAISHMPVPREHHAMVALNNHIYVIGGYDGVLPAVQSIIEAAINPDGSLGNWNSTSSLISSRASFTAQANNNRIYVLGGNTDPGTPLNTTEMSLAANDGSLFGWSFASSMQSSRAYLGSSIIANNLFVVGGSDPCGLNSVEGATINPDGGLGNWEMRTPMNEVRKGLAVVAVGNRMYATGGVRECGDGAVLSSVESAVVSLPPPPPPPPSGPHPVVVVPGFGGSFSTKKFILRQDANDYHDWVMMPVKAPEIYDPFMNSLQTLNYLRGDKVFFFAYDFTLSVAETGNWLNEFLENEVLSENPGATVDVVAHSMGGLVTRYCFESVPGCKSKINKIVSAGVPHRGAVDDYFFWEGADFSSMDPMAKYAAKLLLHVYGLPEWNKVKIIQEKVVGAKDFMPIFDYIISKPYASLSDLAKNPVLETLPLSGDFAGKTMTLSGNKPKSTTFEFDVKSPNLLEKFLGQWRDGKPKKKGKDIGDGTVLALSSHVSGALNKGYDLEHGDYLNTDPAVSDILKFLGLSPIGPLALSPTTSSMIFYSEDPEASLSVEAENGEKIVQPDSNVLFILNPKTKKRKINLLALKRASFNVHGWYTSDSGIDRTMNSFSIFLEKNQSKKFDGFFN